MTTVHVRYVVNGTTVEETWTGERISVQTWKGGRAKLTFRRDGQAVRYVSYRRAERIDRTEGDA